MFPQEFNIREPIMSITNRSSIGIKDLLNRFLKCNFKFIFVTIEVDYLLES